ncbi:hypothetical protein [Devosia sp. 1566]|uniref:hypothetical protein n=1 Tax=Devosia sp. 1566 TaxID=2499144 RepID=UPI0019CF9770|nr:hypothetical protein [Devosia sp. 1566]
MTAHSYRELAAQHLTGRTRVRKGWFGLVPQVEVISPKPRYPNPPPPPGSKSDVWDQGSYTFWRDAKLEDYIVPIEAMVPGQPRTCRGDGSPPPPPKR